MSAKIESNEPIQRVQVPIIADSDYWGAVQPERILSTSSIRKSDSGSNRHPEVAIRFDR